MHSPEKTSGQGFGAAKAHTPHLTGLQSKSFTVYVNT